MRTKNLTNPKDPKIKAALYVYQELSQKYYGGLKSAHDAATIAYGSGNEHGRTAAITLLISNAFDSSVPSQLSKFCDENFSAHEIDCAKELQAHYRNYTRSELSGLSTPVKLAILANKIGSLQNFSVDLPIQRFNGNAKTIRHAQWIQSAVSMRDGKETPEGLKALKDEYERAARTILKEKQEIAKDIKQNGSKLYKIYHDFKALGGIDPSTDRTFGVYMDKAQDALEGCKKRYGFKSDDPLVATKPVPRFTNVIQRAAFHLGLHTA